MPLAAVLLLIAAVLAGGWIMLGRCAFRAGFTWDRQTAKTDKINLDRIAASPQAGMEERVLACRDWLLARPSRPAEIVSFDGLRLRARYYPCDRPRGPIILLAHGYRSSGAFDFSCSSPYYMELGFDLLVIDHRAHGQSEGRYICFGAAEGRDVADWCRWLDKEYPGRRVVLAGISMGATSVLTAAAREDLPDNVAGVVADCGFTDCGSQFRHVLRQMHLPAGLIMAAAQPVCRRRLGFGFWDHSTERDAARIKVPVLFIHGAADGFVPPDNSRRNFAACGAADKELYIVDKADHGQSFLADEAGCKARFEAFIGRLDLAARPRDGEEIRA
ncbi:MAG: alpha/beta fold hydrolase [Firmicutes bacterium]|nr:alpha/beta fold hydrolase [Bacillota bacterium]